jgi:hypothetical protein
VCVSVPVSAFVNVSSLCAVTEAGVDDRNFDPGVQEFVRVLKEVKHHKCLIWACRNC